MRIAGDDRPMKSSQKTLIAWLLLVVMTVLLFQTARVHKLEKHLTFNKFIEHVKRNEIENITFKAHGRIEGKFIATVDSGQVFETVGDTTSEYYVKLLNEHG